jgi:hypothetical protein
MQGQWRARWRLRLTVDSSTLPVDHEYGPHTTGPLPAVYRSECFMSDPKSTPDTTTDPKEVDPETGTDKENKPVENPSG